MATVSNIEWTDATWNPTVGCSLVSPGCTHCYAMRVAWRMHTTPKYGGLVGLAKNGTPVWNGTVRLDERALKQPLRWKDPRRIFVNSMSDLFHEDLPDGAIDRVFEVMSQCPQHTFQVLTKRADRMRLYVTALRPSSSRFAGRPQSGRLTWPLPNVWLGVSVEDQARADERVPLLLDTPAAVRFLSCEPLLGPLNRVPLPGIRWVIVGGESGPRARPMRREWVTSIRDQCRAAGVAFFFKQWGGVRKHRTGRKLDGRTYDEMPALALA